MAVSADMWTTERPWSSARIGQVQAAVGPLGVDWLQAAFLSGQIAVIYLLWSTPFVYPLKILAVLFHELSHGIAACATGGSFGVVRVEEDESGACATRGGSPVVVLSAGYLGSLIWGGALLLLACAGGVERLTSAALGVLLLAVALLFVRPVNSFGQLAVLIWGLVLCLTGTLVGPRANRLALQVVGVASCTYAALDIQEDVIDRPWLEHSDAAELARITGIPVATWGALWLCIAVACTACLVLLASRARMPDAATQDPAESAPLLPPPVWDLSSWRHA